MIPPPEPEDLAMDLDGWYSSHPVRQTWPIQRLIRRLRAAEFERDELRKLVKLLASMDRPNYRMKGKSK